MLFPSKTKINKPFKTKLVQHLTGVEKKELQEKVDKITLSNTLRQDTLNVEKGKKFVEIFVFDYYLKEKLISDKLITAIEKIMPKYIVHIIHFNNEIQVIVSYKEKTATNQIKVIKIFRSEWLKEPDNILNIVGLNIDTIYEGFVQQISNGVVQVVEETTMKEAVEKSVEKEKLQRKIDQLTNKMNKEKQFNKQLQIKEELKQLKKELERL